MESFSSVLVPGPLRTAPTREERWRVRCRSGARERRGKEIEEGVPRERIENRGFELERVRVRVLRWGRDESEVSEAIVRRTRRRAENGDKVRRGR
jgi:hypothetical protein